MKLLSGYIKYSVLFLIIALISTIIFYGYFYSQCNQLVSFSVSMIDSRYKISETEVLEIAKDAALRWNEAAGREVLKFKENSNLKISLVYDQRQADLDKMNAKVESLNNDRTDIKSTKGKLDFIIEDYNADLAEYNSQVESWNKKGGAPEPVFSQLRAEAVALDLRKKEILNLSKIIDNSVESYNNDLGSFELAIEKRKNLIITQGLYFPADQKIEIYTFGDKKELKLVLMHELGHAIGLDHGSDETAIMYYLLGNQNLDNPIPLPEDKSNLVDRCNILRLPFYQRIFQKIRLDLNPTS